MVSLNRGFMEKQSLGLAVQMTLYSQNIVVGQSSLMLYEHAKGLSKSIEVALVALCKALAAPIPLWLDKNTREFAQFHQTLFFPEQFDEPVSFDRMKFQIYDEAEIMG